jgi:N-acetylmuramoyl-L-alanine amidase
MLLVALLAFPIPWFPGAIPGPAPAAGQGSGVLRISTAGGEELRVPLARHRGFPAVSEAVLRTVGWRVQSGPDGYRAVLAGDVDADIRAGAAFVRLDTTWVQLVEPPYEREDSLYLPLQFFTDLLPDRLPDFYRATGSRELRVLRDDLWRSGFEGGLRDSGGEATGSARAGAPSTRNARRTVDDGVRVVIIDPGHGGVDPGTLGRRRTREKDVTLAVARALAAELEGDPQLEVHLTRNEDVLVPLWERGEIATRLKGERYGVFLSIHANSVSRQDVRGVETYFLSEARTEHESRVAALENSAMELERNRPSGPGQGELGAIISELMNLDFQHWSSDLATGVQGRIARVHPGPNRGVKQAPFAVLTNAMMPSVLIELGFISNPQEERTISDAAFHKEVAEAIAQAVRDFFRRYPPGGTAPTGPR